MSSSSFSQGNLSLMARQTGRDFAFVQRRQGLSGPVDSPAVRAGTAGAAAAPRPADGVHCVAGSVRRGGCVRGRVCGGVSVRSGAVCDAYAGGVQGVLGGASERQGNSGGDEEDGSAWDDADAFRQDGSWMAGVYKGASGD